MRRFFDIILDVVCGRGYIPVGVDTTIRGKANRVKNHPKSEFVAVELA